MCRGQMFHAPAPAAPAFAKTDTIPLRFTVNVAPALHRIVNGPASLDVSWLQKQLGGRIIDAVVRLADPGDPVPVFLDPGA